MSTFHLQDNLKLRRQCHMKRKKRKEDSEKLQPTSVYISRERRRTNVGGGGIFSQKLNV